MILNNLKVGQLKKLSLEEGIAIPDQIGKSKLIELISLNVSLEKLYVQGNRRRTGCKKK